MARFRLRSILLLGILIAALGIVAPLLVVAQSGTPEAGTRPDETALVQEGEKIYSSVCMACHQAGGKGIQGIYPALAGNPLVTLEDPSVVVDTVLFGRGGMPRFNGAYSDEQIAGVVSYIRSAWGNHASAVTPKFVAERRAAIESGPKATPISPSGGQNPAEVGTPEGD